VRQAAGKTGHALAMDAIRNGRMEATIAQNPRTLGEMAVDLIIQITQKKTVQDLTNRLPKLITNKDFS
jgi:ABC-type sugar transport system substrate-binding protein